MVDARCGEARRDKAEGGRRGSGLGHGTGLLVIDVAAHTSSVDAWKNHRVQQRGRGYQEAEGVIIRETTEGTAEAGEVAQHFPVSVVQKT